MGRGSDSFFTATPASKKGINDINDDDNGAVENGEWSGQSTRLSKLICAEVPGLWRASSSDHEYAMNDRDDDEGVAWEPA